MTWPKLTHCRSRSRGPNAFEAHFAVSGGLSQGGNEAIDDQLTCFTRLEQFLHAIAVHSQVRAPSTYAWCVLLTL